MSGRYDHEHTIDLVDSLDPYEATVAQARQANNEADCY